MRKGFSLVEVLVAVSLFAVAATVSTTLLVNVVNIQKKASVQNAVYEDARILLQQLTKEIQGGTIDYEEYYNINVTKAAGEIKYYGTNYGVYGSRFFDPGRKIIQPLPPLNSINPDDLGVECSTPNPLHINQSCEIVYSLSSDFNTGQNPYKHLNSLPQNANALCDSSSLVNPCPGTSHAVPELYLIDSTGTRKTIIGRKLMKDVAAPAVDDYSAGIVRMNGIDFDQNGFIDIFSCIADFNCESKRDWNAGTTVFPFLTRMHDRLATLNEQNAFKQKYRDLNVRLPNKVDLTTTFNTATTHFLPITPLKSNVLDLKFLLSPIEDPYKAYAEDNMQEQPSVTIILTLGLSSDIAADYPGTFQPLTVQTTVEAGVIGQIQSYPSVNDILRSGTTSWISTVLPLGLGVNR